MSHRWTVTLAVGLAFAVLLLASAPAFAQDPFAGLTNTVR